MTNSRLQGNATTRARIFEGHKFWVQALLYFYAHDAVMLQSYPAFATAVGAYGLCADEFNQTEHWPPQLCKHLGTWLCTRCCTHPAPYGPTTCTALAPRSLSRR